MPALDSNRNLPNNRDPVQAFSSGLDAARSVLVLGTTAPTAKSLGNPEWLADMEYVWRSRTEPEMRRLQDRARAMRRAAAEAERLRIEYGRQDVLLPVLRVQALRSAEWAEHRARSIAMTRQDVVNACNERYRSVACGCSRFEFKVGCDQPQLCPSCRAKHARKWQKRIADGINAALKRERAAYWNTPRHRRRGMEPGVYLITLTAPHSGDMVKDRDVIGRALRKLLKHADKRGWWSTYALTWEATGGEDGKGHVHVHMAVVSSWIPYTSAQVEAVQGPRRKGERRRARRGLREVWQDAIPGAVQPHVSPPNRAADPGESAGYYLAKYVTKGVEASEFSGRKAGELLCAFRGRRKVSTSAAFWQVRTAACDCCAQPFRSLGAPCSLQDIAPGSVLRSMVVRHRWTHWQQDELFAPWQWRPPEQPEPEQQPRVSKKMNAPSKWVVTRE